MSAEGPRDVVVILDFGSQYTQLIARRVRQCHVYCEIHPYNIPLPTIHRLNPRGIILSGGPASVYDSKAPMVSAELFQMHIPILGICYGMQLMTHQLGGRVASGHRARVWQCRTLDRCGLSVFSWSADRHNPRVDEPRRPYPAVATRF